MGKQRIILKKLVFEQGYVKVFYLKGTGGSGMGNFYQEREDDIFGQIKDDVEQYLMDNNRKR